MSNNVLITGSSGFVGKWLTQSLTKKGFSIIKFDKEENKFINNWNHLKEIKEIDFVFHLAAISFVPFATKNPRLAYEINTFGTLNILELCRLNNAKLIFPSSYIYGTPKYLPIDEKHPINPQNTYAKSKFLAEELIKAYEEDYGLKSIILRFFNIYGPGQSNIFLISKIVSQLKKGKIVLDDPKPKRDFVYIQDAINAYIKAMAYKKSGIFNIGSGKSHSVDEIVKKVIEIYGKEVKVKYLQKRRKNEVMDCVADIKKAEKELKWKPNIALEQGLRTMLSNEKGLRL